MTGKLPEYKDEIMKTDALFYELFRLDPPGVCSIQLVKLNVRGQYVFESIRMQSVPGRFPRVAMSNSHYKRINQGQGIKIRFDPK